MTDNTARLILQVDAAVALAQSNLRALARTVDDTAKQTEGSLARVDRAHHGSIGTMGSVRNAQMELMHVTRAMSDGYAAGMPVSRLFFMELGRISEAATMAGGSLGALGKFLGGPWGMIVSAAVSILGSMYIAHEQAAGGADKHAKAAKSLEEAISDLNAAQQKDILTIQQAELAEHSAARQMLHSEVATRKLTLALLEKARAQVEIDRARSAAPGQRGELGTLALDASTGNAAGLEAMIGTQNTAITKAQQAVKDLLVPIVERSVEGRLNKVQAATDRYTEAQGRLRQELSKGIITGDVFENKLEKAQRARDAAIEGIHAAESAARRTENDNRPSGRHVTSDEAASIVRGIGGQVNSGFRTHARQQQLYDAWTAQGRPADNPVAVPGTSLHESGRALDVQMTAGMSLARIKEAFRAKGVAVTGFEERGHYHINLPGGRGGGNSAESARVREVRHDETYTQERIRAEEGLAKAQTELGASAKAQADLSVIRLSLERARLNSGYEAAVLEKTMTRAQANRLTLLNNQTKAAEIANIRAREQDQEAGDALSIQRASIGTQIEMEQLTAVQLTTRKELRESAIRLLDLSQTQERLELQNIIASHQATETQKKIAEARLAQLNNIRGAAVDNINDKFQSPGARYSKSLSDGLADVHSRIQEIEVHGLQSLEDSLTGAATKALGLSGALGDVVGQLIRIGLERELILPIANALFGGGGGASGSSGGLFASLMSAFKKAPGRAIGGPVNDNTPYMVGEHGPELFVSSSAGRIIPNNELQRRASGGGTNVTQVFKFDARGAVLTQDILNQMNQMAQGAAIAGHNMSMTAIQRAQRPRL